MNIVNVGISEYKAKHSPYQIKTSGLGSCIGIVLYDKYTQIGGISHILLPDSTSISKNTNKAKFADTSIPLLVEEMITLGAHRPTIRAAIFGGARMFNFKTENRTLNIGERNTEKTLETLKKLKIKLIHKEVGGNNGRTVQLNCQTGVISINTVGCDTKTIHF